MDISGTKAFEHLSEYRLTWGYPTNLALIAFLSTAVIHSVNNLQSCKSIQEKRAVPLGEELTGEDADLISPVVDNLVNNFVDSVSTWVVDSCG